MNKNLLAIVIMIVTLISPRYGGADSQTITADATYIMGDGETPSFAESMALLKAKQGALEKAGTYLQSTTIVKDNRLTSDEIQTLAGGVVKVEVLDRSRTLVQDGLRIGIKIRATINTDQIPDLAQRIKGKPYTEEYQKLKTEYDRLAQDLTQLKGQVAKAQTSQDRASALDQIRAREKTLAQIQEGEAALFRRLVSGEVLFSKAQVQLAAKQQAKEEIDALIQTIMRKGYLLTLGEPSIETSMSRTDMVKVQVPVTMAVNPAVQNDIVAKAKAHGWYLIENGRYGSKEYGSPGLVFRPGDDLYALGLFQRAIARHVLALTFELDNGGTRICMDVKDQVQGLDRFQAERAQARYMYVPVSQMDQNVFVKHVGVSPSLWDISEEDRKTADMQYLIGLDRIPGLVVVFAEPKRVIVSMDMPLETAKRIRLVRSEVTDNLASLRHGHCVITEQ
jgi:hypothetical protein